MLKKLIIAIVAVVVLAAGGITVGVVILSQPEVVVKNTLENTVEALADRQELSAILSMLKGGSLEVEGEFEDVSLSGKLYFSNIGTSAEQKIFAEDLYLNTNDKRTAVSGYIGPDSAYITDCSLLDGTVGLVRGSSEADYLASVFVPDSGSEFALDSEVHDLMTVFLRLYDEGADKQLQKDAEKYINKYEKKIGKLFAEHASFEETTDKVRVNGTRMECRVITVTVDNDDLADILADLHEALLEDKSLRKTALSYQPYMNDLSAEIDLADTYDKDFLNGDFWDTWDKYLRDLDFSLVLELVTPRSSATLRQLTVKTEISGEEQELLFIDFGKNGLKKADYITMDVGGITYAYEIAEDNSRLFEAYLHMDKTELVCLEIDRKEEVYTLTLADGTTVTGDFIQEKDEVSISLDKIKNGDSFKLFDIRVTLREKDTFPDVAEDEDITSIFTLGEAALERLSSANTWQDAYDGR